MYKYLVAILIALTSLVAFAHDHGDKGSEKKAEEKAEKKAEEKAEKKAAEPKKIQYEDPKKYYPKK
mgnify:CR=1 FL=1|tara:strand:- start:81 stop:278 length:198 start_codon:yes stop_codon:yes gene_type:complete